MKDMQNRFPKRNSYAEKEKIMTYTHEKKKKSCSDIFIKTELISMD